MTPSELNKEVTVLVVDDDDALRHILAFHFGLQGYRVLQAADVREALRLLEATPVDIVLSDIRMPGLSGLDLLTEIKSWNRPEISVVLMTGYSEVTESEVSRMGASALIPKPFNLTELDALMARLGGGERRLSA